MFAEISGGVSEPQSFKVHSGALRVTDPCYSLDTWCSGQIENVMDGTWTAHVGYHKDQDDIESVERHIARLEKEEAGRLYPMPVGFESHSLKRARESAANYKGRVAYIRVCHESIKDEPFVAENYEHLTELDVGVDSGQAGFFDLGEYTRVKGDEKENEAFYNAVCELTLDNHSFGTIPFGAVSRSGYGDGGYDCYVLKDPAGTTIAAMIVFIGKDEEEDE